MKPKDLIFQIIAAILPVGIYEIITEEFKVTGPRLIVILLASVVSFIFLIDISTLLEGSFSELNKYRGQWVEEMTLEEDQSKFVAVGIIRYDRKTNEHIFVGKTYTLTGNEKYSWAIDYLRPDKDTSMQYICGAKNPNEMSIGQITFTDKDECVCNIWIMDGKVYKYNAYRITKDMLNRINFTNPTNRLFKWSFNKSIMIRQKDYPDFVRHYSEKSFK